MLPGTFLAWILRKLIPTLIYISRSKEEAPLFLHMDLMLSTDETRNVFVEVTLVIEQLTQVIFDVGREAPRVDWISKRLSNLTAVPTTFSIPTANGSLAAIQS